MNQAIIVRPTWRYVFSYLWLAGEILLFNYIFFLISGDYFILGSSIFFLIFSIFYFWLNFSSELYLQILFILGIIPLNIIVFNINPNLSVIHLTGSYALIMILVGIVKILSTKYIINQKNVMRTILNFTVLKEAHTGLYAAHINPRGRFLNFGCLLISQQSSDSKKGLVAFLRQRNEFIFRNKIRFDGIPNIESLVKRLKQGK